MNPKNPRKVWRKLFGTFLEGDIVLWKGRNIIGKIECLSIGWEPEIYRVVFPDKDAHWIPVDELELVA